MKYGRGAQIKTTADQLHTAQYHNSHSATVTGPNNCDIATQPRGVHGSTFVAGCLHGFENTRTAWDQP